jgi:hypothetical protein
VHGGATSRRDKEARFADEVDLLAPVATNALAEVNTYLLLDSGTVSATGLSRSADGGMSAAWELSWPEQRNVRVPPIMLHAYFGAGFHHPHVRGPTVGDWPLNVFSIQDASDQLPILRAIATSDLHNRSFNRNTASFPPSRELRPSRPARHDSGSHPGAAEPFRRLATGAASPRNQCTDQADSSSGYGDPSVPPRSPAVARVGLRRPSTRPVNHPGFPGDLPVWFQAPAFFASTAVMRSETGNFRPARTGGFQTGVDRANCHEDELPVLWWRTPHASTWVDANVGEGAIYCLLRWTHDRPIRPPKNQRGGL